MAIKNRLKEILDKKGIKHKWLAENLGVEKSTISALLNNKSSTSLENAFIIAELLDKKVDEIFYRVKDGSDK